MILKLLFNLIRVACKKRWKAVKFICCFVIFIMLLLRYNFKYHVYWEKVGSSGHKTKPCLNLTLKELKIEPSIINFHGRPNFSWQLNNEVLKHVIKTGQSKNNKALLTIGIPSIKRIVNSTYLVKTLQELELKTSEKEKPKVICVIFLCDLDHSYNVQVEQHLLSVFSDSLMTGFFQVVRVKSGFYPILDSLKRNFNDPPDRVRWRAKQVSDFIFLFRYCSFLGQYHLQLEDDVSTVKDFTKSIQQYVRAVDFAENLKTLRETYQEFYTQFSNNFKRDHLWHQNKDGLAKVFIKNMNVKVKWSILNFSELGFIGKLFQSRKIENCATFLAFFYDEQPVDWLIVYFLKNMGHVDNYNHIPALFQHFGVKSSFNYLQDNKLKDRKFDASKHDNLISQYESSKIQNAINPLALIFSNISNFNFYIPGHQFQSHVKNIKVNETILILFVGMQDIGNITMETSIQKKNCVLNASLTIGHNYEIKSIKDNNAKCLDVKEIAVVTDCLETIIVNKSRVSCISIRFNGSSNNEFILENLLIFPP